MTRLSLSTRYPTSSHCPLFNEAGQHFALSLRQLRSSCRSRNNPSAAGEYIRSISHPPVKTSILCSRCSGSCQSHRDVNRDSDADTETECRFTSGEEAIAYSLRGGLLSAVALSTQCRANIAVKVLSRRHRVTLLPRILIESYRLWPQQNRQRCS